MSRSRLSKGISTAATGVQTLSNFIAPDPTKAHVYFNDFNNYIAGDWVVTATNSGAVALANGDGGVITLTDDAGIADSVTITKLGVGFTPDAAKEMWFEAQISVSDATKSTVLVGLTNVVTDPFTLANLTDGFFFNKPAAATAVDFYTRQDATTGSQKVTAATNMANSTSIILGVYYDGNNSVSYYVNDVKLGTLTTSATTFPNTGLTPIIAIKNGEAVAKVLTVDYILAAKLR